MEKFPTPALSYVLFLFYGSQLAPWVVQQKKRLRREGNGTEAVSGKVICPYERGVQRRGLPDRSDLFRGNGGRVGVLKNMVIDQEIHDACRERIRHKQRSGKYREVAFGKAVEHQISPGEAGRRGVG
ncbi:hypothetical protein [Bradyrhizobium sp.]|uniref:hypothetical protein n=1 Tax=Bradyrhizobium sp. TaxID=376 RepID=UPI003BB1DE3B